MPKAKGDLKGFWFDLFGKLLKKCLKYDILDKYIRFRVILKSRVKQ